MLEELVAAKITGPYEVLVSEESGHTEAIYDLEENTLTQSKTLF